MKQLHSRSFVAARSGIAAACVVVLGAAVALGQSTGASSSTSGTPTNTDRYGSGSSSSRNDQSKRDTSGAQTNASTSGAAAGSMNREQSQTGSTGSAYGGSTDRSTTTDTSASTTDSTMTGRSSDRLSWGDRRFVTKAVDHGKSELELAKLAAEKATNPEVKSYAQKLIDDHETVKSELTTLANQKNVKLDDDDDGKDRTYKRLSKKSGQEFDEEFVEHMVEMHEDDVKMFEKAGQDAKDSELRSFALKHVDHLREHLQQAQSLRQSIMPTGRTDNEQSERSSTRTDAGATSTDATPTTDTNRASTTPTDKSIGSSAQPESRR